MTRTILRGLGRVTAPVLVAVLAAAGLAVQAPGADVVESVPAVGVQGQVHYLPWDAQQFLDTLRGQQNSTTNINSPVRLITSIVSALDGNQIAVDHWEDGYDADPFTSAAATTEILTMDEGESTVLDNLVDTANLGDVDARGTNLPYYDGGDKLVSTGAIVVTAGGWPSGAGTLHAGAAAVREVNDFGFAFESPIGEGMTYPAGESLLGSLWEYVGLVVVASQDDTTVTLPSGTVTLDEGDTHLVDGGISIGDAVTADKPVGVFLSTGDNSASYEGRLFALLPTESWSDGLVTPIGSRTTGAYRTRVFLYNPSSSAISVTYTESGGGTGSISVPANGQANRAVPVDQGVRFDSPGNPFYAVQAVTTPEEGTGNDQSSAHNWGMSLTPADLLTPMVVVGYGPGSDDVDGTPGVDANDSAVWIAPQADTTIYVDLDADPTSGANTDPDGNQYDFTCAGTELTPVLIKDVGAASCSSISTYTRTGGSGDNDMTGARIYTVDGTPLASAWGQVPGASNPGTPAIDMGTTVLPFPTIDLVKDAEIVDDDGDGKALPGDTIHYTITITNRGISPVDDLTVNDQVPVNTTYVAGSTVANGNPVTDPGTGTPFPLDEGGLPVPPVLGVGETRTVSYDLLVDDPLPPGVEEIVNEITLESDYGIYTDIEVVPVPETGTIGDRLWADADGDGTQDGGETGLVGVDVELWNAADEQVAVTTTTTDGAYAFTGVYPGTYSVRVDTATLPADQAPTYDLDGLATANRAGLTLAEGEDRTDVDFGYTTSTISLAKTVYLGHDGGASCPGGELVSGENGDDVTYCFRVTNDGPVTVTDVGVTDADLAIDDTDMAVESGSLASLAPGQSVVLSYDGAITGDLLNTAEAEAFASGGRRTATDTAEVDQLGPGITIEKTVYRGHDGGSGCPGVEQEVVRAGGDLTYCFAITNTGQTNLSAVSVTDGDLGIGAGDLVVPLLTAGQSTTLHVEVTADGDLVNTADVVGTSPAGAQPTDDDTAEVDEIHPALTLAKTVYRGHDGGSSCAGDEQATTLAGDDVTWCFLVTNTGDVDLTDLRIADLPLGVDETDLVLASGSLASVPPSGTVALHLETTADGDVANTATATGTPMIGPDVSDEDDAAVDVITPQIDVQKTVYGGHDGGAGCPGAESFADEDGEPVTWCFVLTNHGDSPLTDLTLSDADLGIDETDLTVVSGALSSLASGDSVVAHYDGFLAGDLTNTASVTGTPLVGPDVTDEDSAAVEVLVPGLTVEKTVYAGHDGGAGCPGGERVVGQQAAQVTWCFVATNTGEVPLDVTVDDPDLGFTDSASGVGPGDAVTFWFQGTIGDDLVNTATVTGETPDDDVVEHDDDAEVDEIHPAITVEKTVYAGHDGGAGCEGAASIEAELGDDVTWCFLVTNPGDVTLTDVELDDPVLGIDQTDVTVVSGALGSLAPSGTLLAYAEGTVDGDVENTVTASGTAPDDSEPSAEDDAAITVVAPQIGIAKTVVAPPTGNGDGTYTLTYRLRVENAGDTRLDGVQVTDDLAATFAGVRRFTVDQVTGSGLSVNWPGYTGRPAGSVELLDGTDSLDEDEFGIIEITVTVDPGANLGPYENLAVATATSPGGEHVDDDSDSGTVSDPTDPNAGEPGDSGGTDDPVPVGFPPIDLTIDKTVGDLRVDGRTALVDWRLVVTNEGPGDDPGPLTVTDELDERLTFVSASGEGWDCTVAGQLVTCVWDAPLAAGASTEAIMLLTEMQVVEDTEIANGAHVESTGAESRTDNNDSAAEVVADAPGETPGSLPRTGATIGGLVLLGLGLVFGGRLLQRRAALGRT